jgi:peptidoglycan/xylan/chitin deacetylase (PgdA/CDA1 family)
MVQRVMSGVTLLAVLGALVGGCLWAGTSPSASPSASPSLVPSPTQPANLQPSPTQSQTDTPTATPLPTQEPTVEPTPAPTSITYTVARGDTLSLIAGRYDTTWQSVLYWNRERYPSLNPAHASYDPNHLEIGWSLIIWPGVTVAYDPPPTPTATPGPTPPPGSGPSTFVAHGSRSSGRVALTFDLGGRTDPALAIIRWLRDHNVPATIFPTGETVDASSVAQQVIGIINSRPDLFDIGNHSYSHPHMATMTAAQVADEVRRAEAAIDVYSEQPTRPLFRAPFGELDSDVLAGVGAAGYRWTVGWDVDTIDWKPIDQGGPTAQQMVDKVVTTAQGGTIVLMHLGGYETFDALPGIVSGLQARGFTLVTLATMLGS